MSTALAERIRARARQIDLPLTRLASDAQVSRSFVYDILYGRSQNPTKPKLERLAHRLRVGVDWLVTGHGFVEGVEPGREGDALYVTIRSAKVTPSMGGGRIVEEVEEGEPLRFLARWVRETLKVQPDDLRIMRVEGDSMEALKRDLEAVRFAADRAFRQYDTTDPANRLVAGELEARWNKALARVTEVEGKIDVAGAIARRDVQAAAERRRQMGVVAANAVARKARAVPRPPEPRKDST
jgi:transcriptional regulator with XRE-family HTH domain